MNGLPTLQPQAWRRLLPGLLLMAAVLLLFRDTATAMVGIWIRSETFAHAFLVPPIVVWLVWRRRDALAALQPRPAPWVLLPMAAVCALWLVADLASVNAATQFALVTLLILSVPAVFGLAVARALMFPLLFLYFAVPVGEFMVPHMMEWTADFTVAAVRMSGVPVLREGLQFVIPTGNWSVVEACSGVRYLIASFMVGTLFAYLNYRSPTRRAVFMAVSLLVPIVANWFRAYMIVMLGHLSGNKLAAGVDHIIYGWVFFGIVVGVMFWLGARWAQADAPLATTTSSPTALPAATVQRREWSVGIAAVLLLLGTQGLMWRLNRPHDGPLPTLALPAALPGGWAAADAKPLTGWVPSFGHASLDLSRRYAAAGSRDAAVWLAYYRDQNYDRKLVTSGNTLTEQTHDAAWSQVAAGSVDATVQRDGSAQPLRLRTATLRGSTDPSQVGAQRLRVWQLYWVGGALTTSDAVAKLQLAANRLRGHGDDAAALFFYTPIGDDGEAAADAVLQRLVAAAIDPVTATLAATLNLAAAASTQAPSPTRPAP